VSRVGILDGNPLFWRCLGMYDELWTKTGVHTGFAFGSLQNLVRGLELAKVDSFLVCWDVGKSSWRRALYPIRTVQEKRIVDGVETTIEKKTGYKCSREGGHSEPLTIPIEQIFKQFEIVQRLLSLAGVVQFGVQGVEADDLVGMLSTAFSKRGDTEVVVIAQDQDYHLLLDSKISQLDPVQKKWYTAESVSEKWSGLTQSQLLDMFAISGAGGDDIPSIKGLGPNGAVKLLQKFGSLENLLKPELQAEIRAMGKKFGAFCENHDLVKLAYELTAIPTVDRHHQLSEEELRGFRDQLWSARTQDRFGFVGLAESYELARIIQKMDVLFRPPPSFHGFEEFWPPNTTV
jgi:5'-3' exonuclease